jgi:osmoprotectant transport system substrate-binding protein
MRKARLLAASTIVVAALILAGCGGTSSDTNGAGKSQHGIVNISGQNFPEAQIMAEIYATVLRAHGFTPSIKLVDTRDVYMQDFPGNVDVVPEYVSGIVDFLITQDKGPNAKLPTSSDPATVISDGKPYLDKQGITLLDPSAATDHNAFFVTAKYAAENHATKLSDLQGKSVVLAAAPDCKGRLDCAEGLESVYGIKITKILPLGFASQQTYDSVKSNESQLGETSTTDATLSHNDLVLLDDDKNVQPSQNLVPAISSDFLKANPDVATYLNKVMAQMTTRSLTELNFDVTVNRQSPAVVAQNWVNGAR